MRRVSVIVDADEKPFTLALARAATEALALKKILDGIRDDNVDVRLRVSGKRDLNDAQKQVNELTGRRRVVDIDTRRADDSINQLTGRLRVVGDLLAIFGPAASPIIATAVPAVTGLAAQLGIAAAAGGTAILAFQGVGDTLEALNKAYLEPTADNLREAQTQLQGLSPAARQFITEAEGMREQFVATRDAAAEGFFPGVTDNLDDLDRLLVRSQDFFRIVGDATGDLVGDSIESLSSERWEGLFSFFETEARPILTDIFGTVGDLTHGLGELLASTQPLNRGFSSWLRDSADDFDNWAAGLDQTEGFQEFVAYVRENGPRVADAASAIGGALIDIGVAAAPLGGPALAALEAFADIISTIADSNIGTPLLTAIAALATLNRGLAIVGKVRDFNVQGTAMGRTMTAVESGSRRASAGMVAFRRDLSSMSREYANVGRAQSTFLSALSGTTGPAQRVGDRVRGIGVNAGKAALGVGALAVATADSENRLGLQNTAILGLAGSMAGPWGAALGASAGLVIDLAGANDDLVTALNSVDASMGSTNYTQLVADTKAAADASDGLAEKVGVMGGALGRLFSSFGGGAAGVGIANLFKDDLAAGDAAEQQILNVQYALDSLGRSMDLPDSMLTDLPGIAARAQPALDQLGLSFEDMEAAFARDPLGRGEWGAMQDRITEALVAMDSGPARARAYTDSVRELANEQLRTAETASTMAAALDAILSPTLNAEEATHAWREQLAALRNELNASAGFEGLTKAGRENAQITRDYVRAVQERMVAEAEAGAGSRKMAGILEEGRRGFIEEGVAAGFSREEMRARANELGLTPRLVRTTFEAAGIGVVERQARNLRDTYRGMPKDLKAQIRAEGIPGTVAEVDRLVDRYGLTEKQRTALLRLRDLASKDLDAVLKALGIVDRTTATPTADVDARPAERGISRTRDQLRALNSERATPSVNAQDNASGVISGVRSALAGIQSKSITITTYLQTVDRGRTLGGSIGLRSAEGNLFGSVHAYAGGGLWRHDPLDKANAHQPMLTRPGGPLRVWAEEETQGEGYVPLANDYRRPRAKTIVEQIVGRFGGDVEWYARGGISKDEREDRERTLRDGLRAFNPRADDGVAGVKREIREFQRALKEAHRPWTKTMAEQAQTLVKLTRQYGRLEREMDKAVAYQAEVAAKFRNDIFGNGVAGLQLQLEADTNDAAAFNSTLKALEKLGLNGGLYKALAPSGDLNTAEQLATMSRAEIAALEKQYTQRNTVTNRLGETAASEVYGKTAAQFTRALDRLDKRIDKLPDRIERGAARGTAAGAARGGRKANRDRDRRTFAAVKVARR